MGAELYDVVASGIRSSIPWEVGVTRRGTLVLSVGPATITLAGDERERFAEAVARAVMPGQRVNHGPACKCTPCLAEPSYVSRREAAAIPHIVTDPDEHRRHGCPTCLQADA